MTQRRIEGSLCDKKIPTQREKDRSIANLYMIFNQEEFLHKKFLFPT